MRFRLATSIAVFIALAAAAPRRASACGALPTPYFTLIGSVPADGAVGVPRDLGIVLSARAWGYEPEGSAIFPGFVTTSIHLFEVATDAEVPLRSIPWMSGLPTAAWYPVAPLAPRTGYRVEAVLADQGAMPAEVTGPTRLTFRFTTGDELAPALEALGGLAMELETYDRDVFDCGPCGSGCVTAGTVRDVRARITIPALRGGFDQDGYRGWVAVREDTPATFGAPGEPDDGAGIFPTVYVPFAPGAPTIVYAPVADLDRSYRACVSLGAWDPAGHMPSVAPVCLDAMRPSDLLAAEAPPGASAGCAVMPRVSPDAAWVAPLALALAAARPWRRARRRARSV